MIRKLALGVGATLLIIGLPAMALAVSRSHNETAAALVQERYEQTEQTQTQDPAAVPQDQVQMRQRLQVHAETGPPTDDYEPTQARQRLHEQSQVSAQDYSGDAVKGQQYRGGGQGGHGQGGHGQDGKNGGGQHGNSDGSGTGECTHEDGPVGSGPYGGTG
ncbi:MAG: hypothetical protein ABFR95_00410 [Actinomycetota bacterium]